jgi:hypothetical protein
METFSVETFPVPNLLPNLFAEMPEPGSRITEAEALRILHELVRPIHALSAILHEQLQSEDEIYHTVSDLILQYWEPAQALLEAWYAVWYEQHGSPAARRRRQAATAAGEAGSAAPLAPAARRRPQRTAPDSPDPENA